MQNDASNIPADPYEAFTSMFGRGGNREIKCSQINVEDPPSNPMHFGDWKQRFYLKVAASVERDPDAALNWISRVEHCSDVEELRETAPFTSLDVQLKATFYPK